MLAASTRPSACTRASACRDTEYAQGTQERGGVDSRQRRAPRCLLQTVLTEWNFLSCTPSPVTNNRGMRDIDLYTGQG